MVRCKPRVERGTWNKRGTLRGGRTEGPSPCIIVIVLLEFKQVLRLVCPSVCALPHAGTAASNLKFKLTYKTKGPRFFSR
jgi:hypothetical protein